MELKKQMIAAIKKKVDATSNKELKYKKRNHDCILAYSGKTLKEGESYCGWASLKDLDIEELFLICVSIGITIKID